MSDFNPTHNYIRNCQVTELTIQKCNSITFYVHMSKEWVNGFVKINCIRIKVNENKHSLCNQLIWKLII